MKASLDIGLLLASIFTASVVSAAVVNSPVDVFDPFHARTNDHLATFYDLFERDLNLEENLDPRLHARWDTDYELLESRAKKLTTSQKKKLATLQKKLASLQSTRTDELTELSTLDDKICNASSQKQANKYIKQYDTLESQHTSTLASIKAVKASIAKLTG